MTLSESPWQSRPFHRRFLMQQAENLFSFFHPESINPKGGFFGLNTAGKAYETPRELHATSRLIHCFSIGHLLGIPGSADMIDHGMSFLKNHHHDPKHGGYFWSIGPDGPEDSSKQAYGHAFVLLAASSAKCIGHPDADRILSDVTKVLETRFWEEEHGAVSEEYAHDWTKISDYRGQNSNMHLTEALMSAFEATGDVAYLAKAERIADLIIGKHAANLNYRVAEHFHSDWTLNNDYVGSEIFRPSGSTPGHWLEWSRLLLQLWVLGGKKNGWMKEASRALFRRSVELGWDKVHGGFFYTLDWENQPKRREKIFWPVTEAIGAAAFLNAHDPDPFHEQWYRTVWNFASTHLIDHVHGNWHPELTEDLKPQQRMFDGKNDLYHSLQACLIPLFPAEGSLTAMIRQANTM